MTASHSGCQSRLRFHSCSPVSSTSGFPLPLTFPAGLGDNRSRQRTSHGGEGLSFCRYRQTGSRSPAAASHQESPIDPPRVARCILSPICRLQPTGGAHCIASPVQSWTQQGQQLNKRQATSPSRSRVEPAASFFAWPASYRRFLRAFFRAFFLAGIFPTFFFLVFFFVMVTPFLWKVDGAITAYR